MIAPEIHQRAWAFAERWNDSLPERSPLLLDFRWPSIGVVDLQLTQLRLVQNVGQGQFDLFRDCTAYLAYFLHLVSKNNGAELMIEDGPEGIEIFEPSPLGGTPILRRRFEAELRQLLADPPPAAGFRSAVSRATRLDKALVPNFMFSVLTRAGGFEAGSDEAAQHLFGTIRTLSEWTAGWYAARFPYEALGQSAPFYARHLIVPSLYLADTTPALEAVQGLLSYFREWSLSHDEMLRVCRNLSECPDELIACSALTLFTALTDTMPQGTVVASAQARGKMLGPLRRTMTLLRAELDLPEDWLTNPRLTDAGAFRFELESALGFLPLMYLDREVLPELLKDGAAREALSALAQCDTEMSRAALDRTIRRGGHHSLALSLQRAFLELLRGDCEALDAELDRTKKRSGAEEHPRYHDLRGASAVMRNATPRALDHFRVALALCKREKRLRSSIANNYAAALMHAHERERALWVLNIAQREASSPVRSLYNKTLLFWSFGFTDQQRRMERMLLELAPFDRQIVAMHLERSFAVAPAEAEQTTSALAMPVAAVA